MSEDEQAIQQSHIKHRRKKNEIEKEFICGDPNCGRKYGTNAALYTHIKNKHNGIAPMGTVKPSTSKKAKESSPERNNALEISGDDDLTKTIETLNDPDFMKFTLMIGNLGQLDERNIIVREDGEDYSILDEIKLVDMYTRINEGSKQFQNNISARVFTKKAENYLRFSSSYWKTTILQELYTVLIYSYIFRGDKFEIIISDIQKNHQGYKLFSELVGQDKIDQFKELYTTIWNFIC